MTNFPLLLFGYYYKKFLFQKGDVKTNPDVVHPQCASSCVAVVRREVSNSFKV